MLEWRNIEYADPASMPKGRWGHSLTVVDNRYLVVCGGLRAGEVLLDTWIFDLTSRKWSCPVPSGTVPPPRWGHTMTPLPSALPSPLPSLVLLGGREGSKPQPLSAFYTLDLITQTWTCTDVGQPAPKPRYAHSATWLSDAARQIVVFGGHGGRSRYYNDVNILQLPATSGAPSQSSPLPHDAQIQPLQQKESILSSLLPSWMKHNSPTNLVLGSSFPGTSQSHTTADMDDGSAPAPASAMSKPMWLTPSCTGTAPSKRSGHACVRLGHKMFVIGGYDGKDILKDMGVLNLTTWAWSTPTITGSALPPLVGHAAVAVPCTTHIIIFGGSVSATEISCSMYVIDTEIGTSTAIHQNRAPAPRFWHRAAIVYTPKKPQPARVPEVDALMSNLHVTAPSVMSGDDKSDVFGCEIASGVSLGTADSLTHKRPPPGLEHMKKDRSHSGTGSAAQVATDAAIDSAYLLVFGGCGERGQAYNDLTACDVTALARGDDLTETLALATPVFHEIGRSDRDASGVGFFGSAESAGMLRNVFQYDGASATTSVTTATARHSELEQATSFEGGLVTHGETGDGGSISKKGGANSITGSVDGSELKVGLVTKRATAPSMAVGMGGVGKSPSSVMSGSTGSNTTPHHHTSTGSSSHPKHHSGSNLRRSYPPPASDPYMHPYARDAMPYDPYAAAAYYSRMPPPAYSPYDMPPPPMYHPRGYYSEPMPYASMTPPPGAMQTSGGPSRMVRAPPPRPYYDHPYSDPHAHAYGWPEHHQPPYHMPPPDRTAPAYTSEAPPPMMSPYLSSPPAADYRAPPADYAAFTRGGGSMPARRPGDEPRTDWRASPEDRSGIASGDWRSAPADDLRDVRGERGVDPRDNPSMSRGQTQQQQLPYWNYTR